MNSERLFNQATAARESGPVLDYAQPNRPRRLRATHYASATVAGLNGFAVGGILTGVLHLKLFGIFGETTLWRLLLAGLTGAVFTAAGAFWLVLRSFDAGRR